MTRRICYAVSTAIATVVASQAFAQSAPTSLATPSSTSAGNGQLADIIVTATKRSESLQNVPVAVTAVGGDAIAKSGSVRLSDLSIPGVNIGEAAKTSNIYIRGVGSGANLGFEQSVPIFIDSVYFGRGRASKIGLLDVDRVEVLKGPQPTFLGNNAIGGAVNVISARPSRELGGDFSVLHEFNANETIVNGAVSVPVTDTFSVRVAGRYRDIDGWIRNVALDDRKEPRAHDRSGRLSALWRPNSKLTIYAKYDHVESRENGRNAELADCGVVNPAGLPGRVDTALDDCRFNRTTTSRTTPADFPRIPTDDSGFRSNLNVDGGVVEADYDLGFATLTSVTSDYDIRYHDVFSPDANDLNVSIAAGLDNSKQFSQELRLASPKGHVLEWLAGFYYDHVRLRNGTLGFLYPFGDPQFAPGPGFLLDEQARQRENSYAVFGELAIHVADPLTLRLGGRYSSVKKSVAVVFNPDTYVAGAFLGVPPPIFTPFDLQDSRRDNKFQPAVTLEYKPVAGVLLYASFKEGFKAGGFDVDALNLPPSGSIAFAPEKVKAYEVGAKTRFADNRGRLNIDLFRSDYSDLQVSVFNGVIGFNTANAARSRSQGMEIETAYAISPIVTVDGTLAYLDGKYRSFPGAGCYAGQPAPACDPVTGTQDLSGGRLQFAPKWSGTAGISLRVPLRSDFIAKDLVLTSRASTFFTSGYFNDGDNDPHVRQSGFAKLDLRIGVGPASGAWEIAFIGKNLTNQYTTHAATDAVLGPFATGAAYLKFLDRTRELAIQLNTKF